MSTQDSIVTYYQNNWHNGSTPILKSADHGTWLGTLVFDGARWFNNQAPDLSPHCERVNASAKALGMDPTYTVQAMIDCVRDGLKQFDKDSAVYIRPMYWSTDYGDGFISADPASTEFALCLHGIPMPSVDATASLTTTRFHRPTQDVATVNAKAACLYPNNARMVREAISKGFSNALVTDALGNVAESATSNVFMVKDGEVFTPVPNGTFLAGITRSRIINLLRTDGVTVHESVLSLDDFHAADEVFLTGNFAKVTPVTHFDNTHYDKSFAFAKRARDLYWDWAATTRY